MANHKSAVKRHRQSEKRRAANRSNLRQLRSRMKKLSVALSSKNVDKVKSLLSPTLSLIDKCIQKGVLHKNAAARHKSGLMRKANGLLAAPPATA
jgi:small subunit ribosomal protein S20